MKLNIEPKLLALSFFFVLAGGLNAATRVWDGGGLDGAVSNKLNWDGDTTIPVSNTDTLQVGTNAIGGVPFIGFDTGEFRTPSFTFTAAAATAYTVTASSVSDFLTLTGTGVALSNSSPVRQKFDIITTTVGATTQTWNGGAQGLILSQIDLGTDHNLSIDGTGTTATTQSEIRGGITGVATSGITKIGSGTLLLNNAGLASDYTGATTITAGRLQLGRPNQIPDVSKLILNGGTFDTGGFIETMASLLVGGSATLDFGTSDTSSLLFGDSHLELWTAGTLNIVNFTLGSDSLRFGSNASALTSAQLAQISFNGMPAMITNQGFLQPVPEPGVSAMLLSSLGILGCYRRRRDQRAGEVRVPLL